MHVAVIGHPGAGGPRILGAAKPIASLDVSPGGDGWEPILAGQSADFVQWRNLQTSLGDMTMAIGTHKIVLPGAVQLHPTLHEEYFDWLGFLLSLEEQHTEAAAG